MKNITFFSPLEQFEILPLFSLYLGGLDFSITNETIILMVIFFLISTFLYSCVKQSDSTLFIVPHRWQIIIEIIYKMVLSMIIDNIDAKRGQMFFPLVFSIFFFIVNVNLIGLIPYSFTLTSHLIVTLALSLSIFIGINIICVRNHGINFFSLLFILTTKTSVCVSPSPSISILSIVF
jgi:ATP synthase subunit 6